MSNPVRLTLLTLGAAVAIAATPGRAPAAVGSRQAPAQTFDVGMLRVQRLGTPGRTPIIFIPALFCGPWQWQREIAALSDRYDIYALTLPGFDGRPRDTGGDLLNRAASDISKLITSRKLDHPVVVGHSLGGTLAVLFGATFPDETRGIIAVEGGYPVAPTAEGRAQRINATVAPYIGVSRAAFGDSLRKNMLQYTITSKADVDSMQKLASRSDPAAVVDWLRAALELDLTPQLHRITPPLTAIVPYDSTIDSYVGYATEAAKQDAYATWLRNAPRGSVVMINHSRHFVMLDQPAAFDSALFAAINGVEKFASTPVIFAPGVISGPANDGAPTFTPDGNTLYFERNGRWGFIMQSHRVNGVWQQPTVAPFSGLWSDQQPTLSPDGRTLVFVSSRPEGATNDAPMPTPETKRRTAALWEVHRTASGWSAATRLPATVNFSEGVYKPSIASDGSLYFMTRTQGSKTFRLYRSQFRDGTYQQATPLSFSDGNHTDVDPYIAPDESFIIFSSAGRASPDDSHEHLYITFRTGTAWGPIEPLRYDGDYEKNPADDGEAQLGPDHHTLFFTSSRVQPIHANRTRAQAADDFARLNLWDNSNNNVWSISLSPWLGGAAVTATGSAHRSGRATDPASMPA